MVEKEKMLALFEAARWAPSCFNEQPWSFIVATREDPAEYERILACLVESNIRWARQAPVLMISVAKLNFSYNDKPNRHAFHDVGLAVENLIVQAGVLGLYVHQMAGFHRDRARETYAIPETHAPVTGIALGYLGDAEKLPEDLREREQARRERNPLERFVFSGTWNQTSSLLMPKQE
jgi:nitroreductase